MSTENATPASMAHPPEDKEMNASPEETLRNGSKPSGNGGLKAPGNKQGSTEKTTSDGGSNLETLRQGSKPQPEGVKEVAYDAACLAKARAMYEEHTHGQNPVNNDTDAE
jgi:hypothetical protein